MRALKDIGKTHPEWRRPVIEEAMRPLPGREPTA
jgi:hypothetical protein